MSPGMWYIQRCARHPKYVLVLVCVLEICAQNCVSALQYRGPALFLSGVDHFQPDLQQCAQKRNPHSIPFLVYIIRTDVDVATASVGKLMVLVRAQQSVHRSLFNEVKKLSTGNP